MQTASFCVFLQAMAKNPKSTALSEKQGIVQPDAVSPLAVQKALAKKRVPDTAELIDGILKGNITLLSRAITLIESTNPAHEVQASKVVNACLAHAGKSVRIGVTGVPGVGKSTFIEAFGKHLTHCGHKVAVLAVDPSSTLSHGSILGDKTRMEELVKDPNAYIRPSASGETLGGVARKTRETITLCEAAGFDYIIIETVGVGQSETAVHSMVDFFLLLKISGAGDELQGIKRGIMEMADAIAINKADGDNLKKARLAKTEFNRALHLFPPKPSGWTPTAVTCSAITREGIAELYELIGKYFLQTKENGYFDVRRSEQNHYWLAETIDNSLKSAFYQDKLVIEKMDELQNEVTLGHLSPFTAAQQLLALYFSKR